MAGKWSDLEASITARIASEPAFAIVQNVAAIGLAVPSVFPAAIVCVVGDEVQSHNAIAGTIYERYKVSFVVLVETRLADALGESRLATGGVWDLRDKLIAKLLPFTPAVTGMLAVWQCRNEHNYITQIEPGAVSLESLWAVDIEMQAT